MNWALVYAVLSMYAATQRVNEMPCDQHSKVWEASYNLTRGRGHQGRGAENLSPALRKVIMSQNSKSVSGRGDTFADHANRARVAFVGRLAQRIDRTHVTATEIRQAIDWAEPDIDHDNFDMGDAHVLRLTVRRWDVRIYHVGLWGGSVRVSVFVRSYYINWGVTPEDAATDLNHYFRENR